MKQMFGVYLHFFGTKIFSQNAFVIEHCEMPWICTAQRSEANSRNPTHSLLRFLVASNSLDLILDMLLELWSAIVGK